MAIYVDAKLAEKNIDNADFSWCTDVDNIIEACIEALQSTPQADVVPVTHAHWDDKEDCSVITDIPWSMCSACGSYSLKLPYCAFCGAKMDEEVDDA